MSGCPRLPRALSVGRCGGDFLAAAATENLTPGEENEVSNLSLPVRSLEISPWNDAEWSLIPPVVSNSILEMRSGLQIVYDMLMSSISSTRASATAYSQVAARLDAYHLDFGKRVSALEMKLDTTHLKQGDILEKLNTQQKDSVQHTASINARLDAHFERTKLLVDSALRKFTPPTDMELDAIALRLSSNPTLVTIIHNMQAQHLSASLQTLQEFNTRFEDVEQQLSLCKRSSQELTEIVANNERQFKQYQARIGDRLRLLDELPTKLEQLENMHQMSTKSSNSEQQVHAEQTIQEMRATLTSFKEELNELRISLTDNINRIEKSSLRFCSPPSLTVPSALPPIPHSRASSERKASVTPRSNRLVELTLRNPNTNSSTEKTLVHERARSQGSAVQQHLSEVRASDTQLHSFHGNHCSGSDNEHEDTNDRAVHKSPKPVPETTYLDEPEFYQDCHRPIAKRVDPQRYQSTVVLATDKNVRPHSSNVPSASILTARDLLPQISAQLPHDSRLLQALVAKLIPQLLPYFRTGGSVLAQMDDASLTALQDKITSLSQQVEPLAASVPLIMNKIETFSQALDTVMASEIKTLNNNVNRALAVTTDIPHKHADLISKVNKKMELVRESLQLCISSHMKSTMDAIDLRDKTYATKAAVSQLSRSIAGANTRLSLHEDIIFQLCRRLSNETNLHTLDTFTDVARELGVDSVYVYDPLMAAPTNSSVNSELSVGSVTFQEQLIDGSSKRPRGTKRSAVVSAPLPKTKQSTQVLPGQSHLASSFALSRNEDQLRISPSLKVSYYDVMLPDTVSAASTDKDD